MRIRFSLAWLKPAQAQVKGFKSAAAFSLVREYTERIGHFIPCEAGAYPFPPKEGSARKLVTDKAKSCVWVCERSKKSRAVTSEDVRELSSPVDREDIFAMVAWQHGKRAF